VSAMARITASSSALRFPVNPTICKSITTIDRATRGARTHARTHTHAHTSSYRLGRAADGRLSSRVPPAQHRQTTGSTKLGGSLQNFPRSVIIGDGGNRKSYSRSIP
jgi:hypothetical protein